MSRIVIRLCLAAGLVFTADLPADIAAKSRLEPEHRGVELTGFSEDLDLSGLARAGDMVLVVADERASVQLGRIDAAAGTIQMQ